MPTNFNETEMAIEFEPGVCSLEDLINNTGFEFTADQAVYIFTTLLEFLLLFRENNYCHSDIKPDNTQLVRCEGI